MKVKSFPRHWSSLSQMQSVALETINLNCEIINTRIVLTLLLMILIALIRKDGQAVLYNDAI